MSSLMSADLFDNEAAAPLAARMRPRTLKEYIGQGHILSEGKSLRTAIERDQIHSMLLWGPPGVGKTTLARLLANELDAQFLAVSAVLSGVKELREAIDKAKAVHSRTILFVDEVHRFNKAQQDAFLPYVEDGTVIFVGATTENPSFEINNALLSRCRVYVLKKLDSESLGLILKSALVDKNLGLGLREFTISEEALDTVCAAADGDARRALNILEIVSDLLDDGAEIAASDLAEVLGDEVRMFDKGGELFYEQISALHKSVRGSDPDASLYWMMRMLDAGCDPIYVARRLVRMASEDIGNADPRALEVAMNAWQVQERLGSPEGELTLAQAVLYLAAAPKSNAVYNAFNSARAHIQDLPSYDVPVHLRNAPSKLMKSLGYGREYRYAHNEENAFAAGEVYFPDEMEERQYYFPVERGLEIKISEKLRSLKQQNEIARDKRS